MSSYYELSLKKVQGAILCWYPNLKPLEMKKKSRQPSALFAHILWMAEEVSGWRTTSPKQSFFLVRFLNRLLRPLGLQLYDVRLVAEATKAGRWVGWMLRGMEEGDFWDNKTSRGATREDVEAGNHLPR